MKHIKEKTSAFKVIKSPYEKNQKKEINELYDAYRNDMRNIVEIDGVKYYKIIHLAELNIGKTLYVVTLDSQMDLRLKDVLIDENGRTYDVKGFEMVRIDPKVFPYWYMKVNFVSIAGDMEKIGDYLAFYKHNN